MKALQCIFLVSLLAACSHQARKVDCDKHLTAINPPAPVVKQNTTPKNSSP